MKYLVMAEGVSDLFPKKVTVQLIHYVTGKNIGQFKVLPSILPKKFNKPSIIMIEGNSWRILDVTNVREESLLFGRKLQLMVVEPGSIEINWKYETPTSAFSVPVTMEYNETDSSEANISIENWRQIEFLPARYLNEIQSDLNEIEKLVAPENEMLNLKGFEKKYIRRQEYDQSLNISLEELLGIVDTSYEPADFKFEDRRILNGFSFQSSGYRYYGICNEGIIVQLGIREIDSVDEEIMTIASTFGLILVDWCNAGMYIHVEGELPEQNIIQI